MRKIFYLASTFVLAAIALLGLVDIKFLYLYLLFFPLVVLGIYDLLQTKRAILRNFPVIGHLRFLLESIRPEIQQYFIEDDKNGKPFSREQRSLVYQRAKKQLDSLPFGTKIDVLSTGHEWINHSIAAIHPPEQLPRVLIGNDQCLQPYSASILNISAMSYGALSKNAVMALNRGAGEGNFAHNTGEGGISPYHLKYGGDLIWQIGTGYFGCRHPDGSFNAEMFKERASLTSVKMIEIKISQGAKPGHGGMLPASKVNAEVAQIRGVEIGKAVLSPPAHSAFNSPRSLLKFVQTLRNLSGGKPIGFKICIGRKSEFLAICKAMLEEKIYPDFIAIDGAEGGTGAAPLEFSNYIGNPLDEGLIFVHSALRGCKLRDKIKLIAAGRIITGFDMVRMYARGADLCYSARAMMFSLGCIQALRCNSNDCPAGVATQRPDLVKGLVVADKYLRVMNFHQSTVKSLMEVIAAAGLLHPREIKPFHIQRRINQGVIKHYGQIYTYLDEGAFFTGDIPDAWMNSWNKAHPDYFIAEHRPLKEAKAI